MILTTVTEANRFDYECEVEDVGSGDRFASNISDISEAGVLIGARSNLCTGSLVRLSFRMQQATIDVTAEVRFNIPDVGAGLRFIDAGDRDIEVIRATINGERTVDEKRPHGERPRPPEASEPLNKILLGSFAVVGLFDVVQMIEVSKLTGCLAITSRVGTGEVHFNHGRIAGAVTGAVQGESALAQLLTVTDGHFEFRKSAVEFQRTIDSTSNTSLILSLSHQGNEETCRDN